MSVTMHAGDSVSASLAECYVTIDGNRYKIIQAIDFEAEFERTKVEVPILGKTGQGNKAVGWKGSGSMKIHYTTSLFRELMVKFKDDGLDTYFEIQVTNEDKTSSTGRQTMVFLDCNLDGGVLAKFDADSDYLSEDLEFTFEDFKMPETFNLLDGMT